VTIDRSIAVLGLGWGDEGKGRVVDALCMGARHPVVVRFSGGYQAAHHVVWADGREHVFAHFGSGTRWGAPTFWSKFCPVYPIALVREQHLLQETLGVPPEIWIDANAPLATPYELMHGLHADAQEHGTCGVGINATLRREEAHFHLCARDLFFPAVRRAKMDEIVRHFYHVDRPNAHGRLMIRLYEEACEEIVSGGVCRVVDGLPEFLDRMRVRWGNTGMDIVWEGSQGMLLDQRHGFFPHVTPSNTGMTNVIDLMQGMPLEVSPFLVTRAYHTRHGNGPMPPMRDHAIAENPWERNASAPPQGDFRRTLLDLEYLRYAVDSDPIARSKQPRVVVTCLDLMQVDRRVQDSATGEIITLQSDVEFVGMVRSHVEAVRSFSTSSPVAGREDELVQVFDRWR
jgi:adenylosuccinate synthase